MKKLITVAAVTAGLLFQAAAFAGANSNNTVSVGSISGSGGFRDARSNSGSTESISCYLGTYVSVIGNTSSINYISCSATSASGANYYCYAYSPPETWVQMVAALNESSWLYFYGDSSHRCQGISSSQGSANL